MDQSLSIADPDEWKVRAEFNTAKEIIAALCAECSVKLAMNISRTLTQDEDQHQLLFQVVVYRYY